MYLNSAEKNQGGQSKVVFTARQKLLFCKGVLHL